MIVVTPVQPEVAEEAKDTVRAGDGTDSSDVDELDDVMGIEIPI